MEATHTVSENLRCPRDVIYRTYDITSCPVPMSVRFASTCAIFADFQELVNHYTTTLWRDSVCSSPVNSSKLCSFIMDQSCMRLACQQTLERLAPITTLYLDFSFGWTQTLPLSRTSKCATTVNAFFDRLAHYIFISLSACLKV